MSSVSDVAGTTAKPAPGPEGGLFVRKSSGLVREIGLRDAVSVATGGVSPYVNIVVMYVVLAYASNASLTWPVIVGALLMVPIGFTYAQLVAALPRSGGDYVYASRIIAPVVGAIVGVGMLLLYAYVAVGAPVLIAQALIPQFLQSLGVAVGIHSLVTFAGTVAASHWWQLGIVAVEVAIALLVAIRGGRTVGRAIWWLMGVAGIGLVLLVINALTHSQAAFQQAYNHATVANAYTHVIASARASGIATGSTWSGFTEALPYMALFYVGFQMNNLPAGELKRPAKTYLRATALCLAVTGAIQLVGWLALQRLTGLHFLQSASALSQANPTLWQHVTNGAPFAPTYYAEIVGSPAVRTLIAGGFVLGAFINVIMYPFVCARVMFALSFDRLLPTRLANVRQRSHMPVNAVLAAVILVLLFAALTIFSTGFVRLARNSLLGVLFVYAIASLGAAILPFRRRDLYDGSPKVLSWRLGPIPGTTVLASVSFVIAGWLFYVAATHTALSGGYDFGSIATLVGIGVAGLVAYAIARTYMQRVKGINISLAMKELPPD